MSKEKQIFVKNYRFFAVANSLLQANLPVLLPEESYQIETGDEGLLLQFQSKVKSEEEDNVE